MPRSTKPKYDINFLAAHYSSQLAKLSASIHEMVMSGTTPARSEFDKLVQLANEAKVRVHGETSLSDAFLTNEPVNHLPTQPVPAVQAQETAKEPEPAVGKKGFLQR